MKSWDLTKVGVAPRAPEILSTTEDARAIVINLPAGEALTEHEVHERAWVVVASGAVEMTTVDGDPIRARTGHLFEIDPGERHEVVAAEDARLLLLLTPWPGDGHPGGMTLEEKRTVRRRAAEKAS